MRPKGYRRGGHSPARRRFDSGGPHQKRNKDESGAFQMNPKEMQEYFLELVGRMKEAGQPDDLIRREDAVNAIRDACIRKHIPFSSNSPEGKRTLEAIWAVYTAPAAIPAQEMGEE